MSNEIPHIQKCNMVQYSWNLFTLYLMSTRFHIFNSVTTFSWILFGLFTFSSHSQQSHTFNRICHTIQLFYTRFTFSSHWEQFHIFNWICDTVEYVGLLNEIWMRNYIILLISCHTVALMSTVLKEISVVKLYNTTIFMISVQHLPHIQWDMNHKFSSITTEFLIHISFNMSQIFNSDHKYSSII